MTTFGKQLREFRQQCKDNKSPHGRLTQEKFGELVGHELGISYSGAAVSDWERGVSKIHADQRQVLISILNVLVQQGGIKTVREANQLLEAGNYRSLNPEERPQIFKARPDGDKVDDTTSKEKPLKSFIPFLIADLFHMSEEEMQELITRAEEGPPPAWPRIMVAIFRRFSDRISVSSVLRLILWVWVWLLAWALITPSLRWPFSSREEALFAVVIYSTGAIVMPALIGALTNTENNEFWQKQSVPKLNLRLYTHQGASIGFHVGYFFVFLVGLLSYNLDLQFATWTELIIIAFPILLAYAGARLTPYNLLRAYKNLNLKNGRIFFIFFLFSPAWGYFLLNSYDILLTKSLGIVTFFIATTVLVAMMSLRYRQSGTTVIPVFWWVIFFGSVVFCQLLTLLIR